MANTLYNIEREFKDVQRTSNKQQIIITGKELNKKPIYLIKEIIADPRIIIIGTYKTPEEREKIEYNKQIKAKIKQLEKQIKELEKELK